MNECINISDEDDEVEVIDHFYNLDRVPPLVDLTDSDTPRVKKKVRDDTTPPDESSGSPIRHQSSPSPPEPPSSPTHNQFSRPPPEPPRPPAHGLSSQPPPKFFMSATRQQAPPKFPEPRVHTPATKPSHCQPPRPPQPDPSEPTARQQTSRPPPLNDRELMKAKKELGNKKFRCNELDQAIRNYKEASELAKKLNDQEMSAILHFNLAMSYDKLNLYNQAIDECAEAVKLDDKYIKAHVKRAEIYMSRGKFDEAVLCYEHICEIDSTKKDDAMRRIAQARELAKTKRRRDQYEILGLRPNFTLEDLRAAYKRMARTHHPDKHSDADVVTRRIQERLFKEASEAYTFFRKRLGH